NGAKIVYEDYAQRTEEFVISASRSIVPQEELKKAWRHIPPELRNVMAEEVLKQHWSKLNRESLRALDASAWHVQKIHERRNNKDRKKATTPAEAEASARDDATPVLDPGVVAEAEYTTPAASARDDATPEMDSDMVADAEDTAPAADHVPWRYDPIRDL
ncbi:hypothetical protein LTR49_028606, partial [Elasticomyces elasticus]